MYILHKIYVNSIHYDRLITAETMIWLCSYVKEIYYNICFILENFVLLLNHFLVISTANIRKVVSMLFCQHWSNQQTKLSLSTKYKSWNNIDLSTLNQRCFANVESTSINVRFFQLSFSTKCQRRNNVDERWPSTLFQRWINVNVFAG